MSVDVVLEVVMRTATATGGADDLDLFRMECGKKAGLYLEKAEKGIGCQNVVDNDHVEVVQQKSSENEKAEKNTDNEEDKEKTGSHEVYGWESLEEERKGS